MAQRTTIQHILSGNMRKAYLCFDFILDLSDPSTSVQETRQATLHNSRFQRKEIPFVLLVDGPFQQANRTMADFLQFGDIAETDTYRDSNQLDELVQKVSNYLPTSTLLLVYRLLIPKLILRSVIVLDGEIAGDGKMARTPQMLRFVPLLRQSKLPRRFNLPYSAIHGPALSSRQQRQVTILFFQATLY
ncbi:hypothetical protein DFH11DRAFT_1747917 [Phellopilus nigrolimitatus]|nr:hypothetical protein DFH11DRAFT_1747917 [Phellopilus nigrolimitatus]